MAKTSGKLGEVGRVYDRYSGFYDALFGWSLQDGRKKLARVLRTRPGERLLEIGVGSGLMLGCYPREISIVGIDISERMLVAAEKRCARLALDHVALQRMDGEQTTFESGSFDHVVIAYVYSVTPDPDRLMREARRLCKPNGNIYVINHFSGFGWWAILERPLKPLADVVGFRTEFPFEEYVTGINLKIVHIHKVNVLGLSRLVHFLNTERQR